MRATLSTFNITHTIRTSLFALLTIVFLLGCNDEKPQTKDTDNGSVFKSNGQLFYFPNANAGSNQQLKQGKALFLDANKSSDSDGSIVSYEWKEGNIVLSNAVSFSKSDFSIGTHTITLTVTDEDDLTDSDTIDIVVIEDIYPIAVAENNETIKLGSNVTLDADKSSDSDGSIVSYEWKEDNAVLSNAVSFSKSDFSLGTHTVTLTVIDDYGNISTDSVVIQVFKGEFPIADTGDNISSRIGDNVFLNASQSSDSDGTIIGYEWKEGNVILSNSSSFSKSDFSLGTHTIVLTVTDDDNNSNSDDINITIYDNEPPIANAGLDQSVRIGKSVTLNASGSSDNDGFIVSYEWKEGETLLSSLSSFSKSDFSLGAHIIVLTVTDNDGVTKQDTINVNIIENIAPVADAGEDIKVIEGDTAFLDASSSTDSDGSIVSYEWKEGCNILSTEATFSHLFSTSTTIDSCTDTTNGVQGGVHTVKLTITDDSGATHSDELNVTVITFTSETLVHRGLEYKTVMSPKTFRVWLDRNLGATKVCQSSSDNGCFGDHFQWGRNADGHEKLTSLTTNVISDSLDNLDDKFVTVSKSPYDWTTADSDAKIREARWSKTDGSSICPAGYYVPSRQEITNEFTPPVSSEDAFNNFLQLPTSGVRMWTDGTLRSTSFGIWAHNDSTVLYGGTSVTNSYGTTRTYGYPVRCIKEE